MTDSETAYNQIFMKTREATKGVGSRGRYEIEASERRLGEEAAGWGSKGPTVVSATEAARNFSELINRVSYRGDRFVVEKGGKPMCELSPVETRGCSGAELLSLLTTLTRPAEEFLDAVEQLTLHQAPVERSPWDR